MPWRSMRRSTQATAARIWRVISIDRHLRTARTDDDGFFSKLVQAECDAENSLLDSIRQCNRRG